MSKELNFLAISISWRIVGFTVEHTFIWSEDMSLKTQVVTHPEMPTMLDHSTH